jgi:hypothetical protein
MVTTVFLDVFISCFKSLARKGQKGHLLRQAQTDYIKKLQIHAFAIPYSSPPHNPPDHIWGQTHQTMCGNSAPGSRRPV